MIALPWRRRAGYQLACAVLLCVVALSTPAAARACSLDGIASISMNGTTASLTQGTPSPADATHWAPFSLLAAAPGDTLHLSENLSKVRNSLSAAMLRTPFRWIFDDGAVAQGYTVAHRFSTLGWHKITVDYFYPARRQWITFDSAQLHIVPAGSLFWTNLPHYASKVLLVIMRAIVWALLGTVMVALLFDMVRRRRAHGAEPPAGLGKPRDEDRTAPQA